MKYSPLNMKMIIEKREKFLEIKSYRRIGSYLKRFFAHGAQNMGVLNRWEYFKDDVRFKSVIEDAELIKLSEELFDDVPCPSGIIFNRHKRCGL
jgi:hypothetical protein